MGKWAIEHRPYLESHALCRSFLIQALQILLTIPGFLLHLSSCHSRTGRVLDAVRTACPHLPIRMARLAVRACLLCMGRAIATIAVKLS
ncbi:hypothetical protein CTA2_6521 [Colletotrichum tanaceti]|uniref:Uncharacterized protein n=1 Tax=Colletotrichum tanaceti TaxID=1306861 RepID=A0A4U6XL88_9PEZI|nr:hypothetical protein CTA2_6521 [Colletotrichum tanaceti]TKW56408.1 hypothetical protein CTA1_10757 [Colletotrichum tanaceti]